MPELPEVETVRAGLAAVLPGLIVSSVAIPGHAVFRGKRVDFKRYVEGRRVEAVDRHGKYLLIEFQPRSNDAAPYRLLIHLGMTGRLLWVPTKADAVRHTHIVFRFRGRDRELRYADIRRFGWMEVVPTSFHETRSPDAWAAPLNEVENRLRSATGFLKGALMSQRVVSGLGNIYVDEALFRAGLHPRRRFERLTANQRGRLAVAIRAVLGESIALGGTSVFNYVNANGEKGGFKDRLRVYGREGGGCPCGAVVRRIVLAGRSTFFCPNCQPAPRGDRRLTTPAPAPASSR